MANIILVMGLPGSGKSTLSNKLAQKIGADHFRSDEIRAKYNDWDFSESGRRRQAERMKKLGDESRKTYAICDFICPKKDYRNIINPKYTIWMDTIAKGRYEDTNEIFEKPDNKLDYHFKEFKSDEYTKIIAKDLIQFDWKKPTVQMLGRWQPWHDGHYALFERCYQKTGQVVIQVRDVEGSTRGFDQDDNPFDFEKVCENINQHLNSKGFTHGKEFIIQLVPNIVNITYGRKVGYKLEEESFEEKITKISATKIREKLRKDGKL
tara:strand:+ start:735 stop:1529 length:795 start_codon:yes stop_codon:yes gene_type:complete